MKSMLKTSALMLLGALTGLTACQSEPEVGSTLYPTEPENFDPKTYIHNGSLNLNNFTLNVIQTPAATVIPNDTAVFYVKLSKPVAQDVTVTVKENNTAVASVGNNLLLEPGAVAIENATVTIPHGQMQSTLPVKITIKEGDALNKMLADKKNGVTAVSIESATGVSVARQYNCVQINVHREEINIYKGKDMDGLTQIPYDSYSVTSQRNWDIPELSDGTTIDYYYDVMSAKPKLTCQFDTETSISGIALLTKTIDYYYGYYDPTKVMIETSNDMSEWTGQGTLDRPASQAIENFYIHFYTPVKAKYLRISLLDAAAYNTFVMVGELQLFK